MFFGDDQDNSSMGRGGYNGPASRQDTTTSQETNWVIADLHNCAISNSLEDMTLVPRNISPYVHCCEGGQDLLGLC